MYDLHTPDVEYSGESEAITLDEVRGYLELGANQTGRDTYLLSLIPGARSTIENEAKVLTTSRTVTATFRVRPFVIRRGGYNTGAYNLGVYSPGIFQSARFIKGMIVLPRGPLETITTVRYLYDDSDVDALDVTADHSIYRKGGPFFPPAVYESDDTVTVEKCPDKIEVVYAGGHAIVPAPLKIAMMQLLADWASFKGSAEELLAGRIAKNLPGSYRQTLMAAGYRVPQV